jgi:hypothetical protein
MTHGELVEEIRTGCADIACLFKNHSGVARYVNKGKRSAVRYGVGPDDGGGHDLIGWRISDGKFVSIDAKVGRDKLSAGQIKWMGWVVRGGGLSGEARSVDEARAIINGA